MAAWGTGRFGGTGVMAAGHDPIEYIKILMNPILTS
jgi:hypothetical protein